MKLLIASPASGGLMHSRYVTSLFLSVNELANDGHEVGLYTLDSESLIPRGRNRCAAHALSGGYDKILFIDADLSWTYPQMRSLFESKREIIGGTYPLKTFPMCANLNALPEHTDLFGIDRQYSNLMEYIFRYADRETGEIEVRHIPTGFLLIDCSVFRKLMEIVPTYENYNPNTKQKEQFFDFFPSGVVQGDYFSEDWFFCEIARSAGYKIYFQSRAILPHTGTWHYTLGQNPQLV